MKQLVIIIIVFAASMFLRENPLMKGQVDIHNKDGQHVGFTKPNPLFESRTDVFSKDGTFKGYFKRNFLFKDRVEYREIK